MGNAVQGGFLLTAKPAVMLCAKEMWSFVIFWQNGFNRHFRAASMISAAEKRWGGFSEMQDQVMIKKEWIKQELFHLVLFP